MRLANRRCERFSGQEVGLSIAPPMTKEDGARGPGVPAVRSALHRWLLVYHTRSQRWGFGDVLVFHSAELRFSSSRLPSTSSAKLAEKKVTTSFPARRTSRTKPKLHSAIFLCSVCSVTVARHVTSMFHARKGHG